MWMWYSVKCTDGEAHRSHREYMKLKLETFYERKNHINVRMKSYERIWPVGIGMMIAYYHRELGIKQKDERKRAKKSLYDMEYATLQTLSFILYGCFTHASAYKSVGPLGRFLSCIHILIYYRCFNYCSTSLFNVLSAHRKSKSEQLIIRISLWLLESPY